MLEILAASAASLAVSLAATPPLIRALRRRGSTAPDLHKPGRPQVASPGGPALLAGIAAGLCAAYLFSPGPDLLAVLLTAAAGFAVGYVDDRKVTPGWFKPAALAGAAAPLLLLGAYDHSLAFPLFGPVSIPVLYAGVAVAAVSVSGNTVNSIDIFNGLASGFVAIAGAALTAGILVVESLGPSPEYGAAAAGAALTFAALGFRRYHRFPSSVFPGNSGALALGAAYGAVAVAGGAEVIAAVAALPAVLNSFLYLASVRRLAEHRDVARPVRLGQDSKLHDTRDALAPMTLARLILSRRPMGEKEAAGAILRLAAFSGALAVITALLQGMT